MKESWQVFVVGTAHRTLEGRAGRWDSPCPFLRSPSSSPISVSAVAFLVPAELAAIAWEHFWRANLSFDVSFPQPFAIFLQVLYSPELIRKARTPSWPPTKPSTLASTQSCRFAVFVLWLVRWLDWKNASGRRA